MTTRTADAHVGAFLVEILLLARRSGIGPGTARRSGAVQALNRRGGRFTPEDAARLQECLGRLEHFGRA
jgi:hypothetical protein